MLERRETQAEWTTITCDVPRCWERVDTLYSHEAWCDRDSQVRIPTAEDRGWSGVTLSTADGHTDKHLYLCPNHAPLAEHYDLLSLLYAAIVQPDPDRLPQEF